MKSVKIQSLFWSVFCHIRTEYGDLLCKSPDSVRIRENRDCLLYFSTLKVQRQPPEVFYKKDILKNFAKFTGNTCAWVSFLIKLQASACNLIRKETLAHEFSVNFAKVLTPIFFQKILHESGRKTNKIWVDSCQWS